MLVLLIICIFAAKAQQDPQFSLNKFSMLTVNPGFAGSNGAINMSLLNRYQWVGFPGAPVTNVFNVDASLHLIGNKDGIGVSIVKDVIGYEKNISVGLSYSWRTIVAEGTLGTGISLGLMNKNLNMTDINRWSDMSSFNTADPGLPQAETSSVLTDIGLGLYYQRKNVLLSYLNFASQ